MDYLEPMYDFFISHNGRDSELAGELETVLEKINQELEPDRKWKIFLDVGRDKPLEKEVDWKDRMLTAAANSRYLIFLTTSPTDLTSGQSWMREEVQIFYDKHVTRVRDRRPNCNVDHFGIIFADQGFRLEQYVDSTRHGKYHGMYNVKHLLRLDPDSSLSDAFHTLKAKVQAMMGGNDDGSAKILDYVNRYVRKNRDLFSMDSVDDLLLPKMFRGDKATEEDVVSFDGFCGILNQEHAAVLGEQGGCGKTTFMTRLFLHHLARANAGEPGAMIPLFVEARDLAGKDCLIPRYLAEKLFRDYTARKREDLGVNAMALMDAFSTKSERPRYLLLVDGCNEIPEKSVEKFQRELRHFDREGMYSNVRVVLAGRTIDEIKNDEISLVVTHLGALEDKAVNAYLDNKMGTRPGRVDATAEGEQFQHILKIPMFLRLYAESSVEGPIDSKAQLVRKYILRQEQLEIDLIEDAQKAFCPLCLRYILPAAAYKLVMGKHTESTFSFTTDELYDIMEDILEFMMRKDIKKYYSTEYLKLLKRYKLSDKDSLDLAQDFLDYLEKTCKLLRKIDDDRYEFVHQVYRDYFCGSYISEDILRSIKDGSLCESLIQGGIAASVGSFVAELLEEPKPFWNKQTKCVDYGDEQNSRLVSLLGLSGRSSNADAPLHTANVIALLRIAREDDLSGLDFSGMDLTKSDLRACVLARQCESGWRASSFCGAVLNPENLLTIRHNCPIRGACANEQYLATLDEDGIIMLWDRSVPPVTPLKIMEGARFGLFKILFAPDGQSLYGVNDSRILRIPIPQASRSTVEPEIVHETIKRFADIMFDDKGELCFTTAMNPFNPKPVSDPHRPDRIVTSFDKRNACAAVNKAGTQLAYGFSNFHISLRLHQYNASNGMWEKFEYRYGAMFERFADFVEETIKNDGFYKALAMDKERSSDVEKMQGALATLRKKYGSGRVKNEQQFRKYLNRVFAAMRTNEIHLSGSALEALEEKCIEVMDSFFNIAQYAHVLHGQKNVQMHSVMYRSDDARILVAYSEEQELRKPNEPQRWRYVVSEIDPEAVEVYPVTTFSIGKMQLLGAQYVPGGIMVTTPNCVTIFAPDGKQIMELACPNADPKYLTPEPYGKAFYVYSRHFVYKFLNQGGCILALNNIFRTELLARVKWKHMKLLVNRAEPRRIIHKGIDLENCAVRVIGKLQWCAPSRNEFKNLRTLDIQDQTWRIQHGRLLSYCGDKLVSEVTIPFSLFVCGCDFRGIRGKMAEREYLEQLSFCGAMTDPYPKADASAPAAIPAVTPSAEPFAEGITEAVLTMPESNADQLDRFREHEYSVMEWIDRLKVATPEMIFRLMRSGEIAQPAEENADLQYVSGRMDAYLCRNKIVTTVGTPKENRPGCKRAYTVSKALGAHILKRGTDPHFLEPTASWDPDDRELRRWLKTGNWFTQTVCKHPGYMTDYAFYHFFHNKHRLASRGWIDGYVVLGEQPFLAEPVLELDSDRAVCELQEKAACMCAVACGWEDMTRFDLHDIQYQLKLSRVPVLIFVGSSLDHCRQINAHIQNIDPRIRKLYTYDALLEDGYIGPMYFEFTNDQPFGVTLDDLIR